MAKCNFRFSDIQDPQILFTKAKEAIEDANGTIRGNTNNGSFQIPVPLLQDITGKYRFGDNDIQIEITTKPAILTCKRIEEEIISYLPPNSLV